MDCPICDQVWQIEDRARRTHERAERVYITAWQEFDRASTRLPDLTVYDIEAKQAIADTLRAAIDAQQPHYQAQRAYVEARKEYTMAWRAHRSGEHPTTGDHNG